MCVIYACKTAIPPEDELRRGAFLNDDGAGLAWLSKDKKLVHWKKGLKDEKDVLAFIEKEKLQPPLAIHFRTVSTGFKCEELCHPFPLDSDVPNWLEGTAGEVLFHNGSLANWEELVLKMAFSSPEIQIPFGDWSDTRALAWLVHWKGEGILEFILNKDRVLIFSAEPNTLEDAVYNPAEDHFSLYGSWNHHKEGWAQSVSTDYCTPVRQGTEISVYSRGEEDDDADAWRAARGWTLPAKSSTISADSIWTLEELTTILTTIEKEQEDARTTAG